MRVERYTHKKHLPLLTKWLSHHGMSVPPLEYFSDTGLVVDGVVIGFLFLTNSGVAWVDNLAADPKCPVGRKREAVDRLVRELEDIARFYGKSALTGIGNSFPTRLAFERNGFAPLRTGYTHYMKELG